MMTKSDWQAVYERLTAEDRRKLGDPPTVAELEAYSQGELSHEEEQRIRALLAGYPDLAQALAAEFPDDDALPGDEHYVSEAEVSRRLAAFHKEAYPQPASRREPGQVVLFRYIPTAIAAALALVFAGLYWQAQSTARRLSSDAARPRALNVEQLRSENVRGPGGALPIRPAPGGSLLQLHLRGNTYYDNYRITFADAETNEVRGTLTESAPLSDDMLIIFAPRELLTHNARLRITVYGVSGAQEQRIDSYLIQVAPAAGS